MNNDVLVKDLETGYGTKAVIEGLSFRVKSPFFLIIMGPNGAGKTTLLRTLIGSIKPISGSVVLYGIVPWKDKAKIRSIVGYAPQVINIREEVPVTVEEVVGMGLLSKLPPPRLISGSVKNLIKKYLNLVGLDGYEKTFFNHLSGGQQKRVLIASALIRRPKVLILDEPGSMLDFKVRCELSQLIEKIFQEGMADVIVTAHDIPPCLSVEPYLLLLNRERYAFGRISEVLKKEILSKIYPGITESEGLIILGEDHVRP